MYRLQIPTNLNKKWYAFLLLYFFNIKAIGIVINTKAERGVVNKASEAAKADKKMK